MASSSEKPVCSDTLRLSDKERKVLNQELDTRNVPEALKRKRTHNRIAYRIKAVPIRVQYPNGSNADFLVRPRDISSQGLGFLHGTFLYPGTVCTIVLRTLNGQAIPIDGKVVRCDCIQGRVHEIGVQFNQLIDISEFVSQTQNNSPAAPSESQEQNMEYEPTAIIKCCNDLMELAVNLAPLEKLQAKINQLTKTLHL